MGIPQRLLLLQGEKKPDVDIKRSTEAWINQRISYDKFHGFSQDDFTTVGMEQTIQDAISLMRKRGYETYQGGGNIFYVKYRLNQNPIIVHIRPLGQRRIELVI